MYLFFKFGVIQSVLYVNLPVGIYVSLFARKGYFINLIIIFLHLKAKGLSANWSYQIWKIQETGTRGYHPNARYQSELKGARFTEKMRH